MSRLTRSIVAGMVLTAASLFTAAQADGPLIADKARQAPVYFVVHQRVLDGTSPEQYVAALTAATSRRGATLIAAARAESLGGDAGADQTIVMWWPSRAAFFEFWSSDENQQLNELRGGAARWQAQLVPALRGAPDRVENDGKSAP